MPARDQRASDYDVAGPRHLPRRTNGVKIGLGFAVLSRTRIGEGDRAAKKENTMRKFARAWLFLGSTLVVRAWGGEVLTIERAKAHWIGRFA